MLRKTFATILVLVVANFAKPAQARQGGGNPGPCTAQSGQQFINEGSYAQAIKEFTCVIDADPTGVEGYRGRIEAKLLLGRYSDAVGDFTRVTAFVLPVHPDAKSTILAGYAERLANVPDDVVALTGASFARWCFFDYASAIPVLNDLLDVEPLSVYGNLFRGSSRLLHHSAKAKGAADIEVAIALAPNSADVHFIVADAYTYGVNNPVRGFQEATLAEALGLETPRIHAILASGYLAFGDELAAAEHIQTHIELVTTELLTASPLAAGGSLSVDLVPGRTYEIPVAVNAGETLSIATSSHDYWDTIIVLLAPDGSPVVGGDDFKGYFAGFEWIAESTATYQLRVTFFESAITGTIDVVRR